MDTFAISLMAAGSFIATWWAMREWVRRIDSSNAVSLQILDSLPRGFAESLDRSLEMTPAFGDNPEMASVWDEIFTPISDVRKDLSLPLDKFYKSYLESIQTAIEKVNAFEKQYADFLDENSLQNINTQKNDLGFYEKFSRHMAWARKQNSTLKNPIKKLALIEDLYRKFDEDIIIYIEGRSFSKAVVSEIIVTLDGFYNVEALLTLPETPVRGKKERNSRDSLVESIYIHAERLRRFSNHLSDSLAEAEKLCLSPHSAEGKALQRIESSTPSDWIAVIQEDEKIDEDALDEWLTARGYPI